jgi:hypothetical protein
MYAKLIHIDTSAWIIAATEKGDPKMRDRLVELMVDAENAVYQEKPYCTDTERIGRVADHLIAEGVIVPPCKVGDKVYYLNTHYHIALRRNTIYEAKVARIVVTSLGVALVLHIRDESGCCETPDIKDYGKTVFLTREEAEAALAERREG